MTPASCTETCERFQLLILRPQDRTVLTIGPTQALPFVEIPLFARPAEQITKSVRDRWALECLVIEWLPTQPGGLRSALLELLSDVPQDNRHEISLIPMNALPQDSLPEPVHSAVSMLLSEPEDGRRGLARFGWLREITQWVRTVTGNRVTELINIRQLNAGASFALMQFTTNCGAVFWLKAVGPPNLREYEITSHLAKHCDRYLPKIVAFRRDWNAWMMEHSGMSLHSSSSLSLFELAATRLGELQRSLIGKAPELLSAQCVDHRIPVLDSHIDQVMDYLDEAMQHQVHRRRIPLSRVRLRQIGSYLHATCNALADLDVPDSIMHGDISPGSILFDGSSCVFTDWCEGYVGNPFVTIEQMCVHIVRKTNDPRMWRRQLLAGYKTAWLDVLTEPQIDRAMKLVSLLSVFSYLYARGDWLEAPRRYDAGFESYSRGLANHMDHITLEASFLEALC